MKHKDILIIRKILEYCNQLKEACDIPELKAELDRILQNGGGMGF